MKNGKTLTLVKMGCDFFDGDRINQLSDCENYRIETRKDLVKGKDGNEYFLSFGGYDKRRTRYTNKRTGARLKHPVDEVVLENALHIDTMFENDKGAWRNSRLESELCDMDLTYTKADILKAVNYISCDNYTAIEIVKR